MNFLKSKYLTPIALLIFFMPFVRYCKPIEKKNVSVANIDTLNVKTKNISSLKIDSTKIDSAKVDLKENSELDQEKSGNFSLAKKEVNFNAYQLGFGLLNEYFQNGIKMEDLKDINFYATNIYFFIILFSILIIFFSWKRKYLLVINLAIVNIVLLIVSMILMISSKFIDEFSDVKYGMYVFIIYSILIIYISNKENLEYKKLET